MTKCFITFLVCKFCISISYGYGFINKVLTNDLFKNDQIGQSFYLTTPANQNLPLLSLGATRGPPPSPLQVSWGLDPSTPAQSWCHNSGNTLNGSVHFEFWLTTTFVCFKVPLEYSPAICEFVFPLKTF